MIINYLMCKNIEKCKLCVNPIIVVIGHHYVIVSYQIPAGTLKV